MAAGEREPGYNGNEGAFIVQPTLEGLETSLEEVTVDYCIVTAHPTYTKQGQRSQWECSVYAPPDIFHQDRDTHYELHTTTYAQEARRKHVKPGDIVTLTGTPWTQELDLHSGEKKIIHHLTVSSLEVISRAPRKSITIYEQQHRK